MQPSEDEKRRTLRTSPRCKGEGSRCEEQSRGVSPLSYTSNLLTSNTQTYKAGIIIISVGGGTLAFVLESAFCTVYGRK
jgi:hypothetical protein